MDKNAEHIEFTDASARKEWGSYCESGMPELIAHYTLVQALFAFTESGMAEKLSSESGAAKKALFDDVDAMMGAGLVRYLGARGVLIEDGDTVRLTPRGHKLVADLSMAQLGFYRQAYGPVFEQMTSLLKGKLRYGKEVQRDGEALGRHCAVAFHYFGTGVALEALASLGANTVLDLGCGGGQFLIDACQRNPKLRGIGLDISAEAIEFAKKLVAKAGLSDRITLVVGDAFRPESWPAETQEAEAIFSVGTMHENFRDGESAVVALLDKYAARISTGKLKGIILGEPELVVNEHDADFFLAHVFTLQGMPRPRAEWLKVFPKTQLECRRVFSAPDTGPSFAFYELRKRT